MIVLYYKYCMHICICLLIFINCIYSIYHFIAVGVGARASFLASNFED